MSAPEHAVQSKLSQKDREEIREELGRVLGSSLFHSSKRCHDFLEFIVNRTLDGDTDGLSERFLGADLFGRPVDYDTKADSIVRVRANDVRRRLTDYYSSLKSVPSFVISLSSGSYVPEFHRPSVDSSCRPSETPSSLGDAALLPGGNGLNSEPAALGSSAHTGLHPGTLDSQSELLGRQASTWRRRTIFGAISAGVVILLLSASCFFEWRELHDTRSALYPWKASPAVAGFWNSFLVDQRDTDLVLSDSSFSLVQALTNKPLTLSDYLARDYPYRFQEKDPQMAAALTRISNWGLGSPGEFEVAQRILALDPNRKTVHLYFSRKYMPDMIKRDNVILIGSPFGNPWAELFSGHMNFSFEPSNPNEIVDRSPVQGESRTYEYTPEGSFGYCIIAYLPNPDRTGDALLIQGSSAEPTQAAGDFLLSESQMSGFKKMLGSPNFPYFELLIKTSWVKGTPINSSIVAFRTYPKSN